MTKVGVFDYGSGNLHSVTRALTEAGADVTLSADQAQLWRQDALVVPGVGAFAACMASLEAVGGVELIRDWVDQGKPLLGICVGHQILFSAGAEHGVSARGLGIYPGVVRRLDARRLPHMGWNTVAAAPGSRLFQGCEADRFYFVHSYAAMVSGSGVSSSSHEGTPFVAAMESGHVSSTQFHPEKSGSSGARLLRNWVASSRRH